MKKTALITAAFSGGHIFPAIALADSLNKRLSLESVFITTKDGFTSQIEKKGHKLICFGPRKGICDLALKLWYDIIRSSFIIQRYKPSIVVGFGGGISIAPFIAARLFNIPTMIHEQNKNFGRANKLLKNFSDKVSLGFPQEKDIISSRLIFTGNPLREELLNYIGREEARGYFGFSKDRATLLIIGGSQGSHKINIISLASLKLLKNIPLQIIHITGSSDYEFVSAAYKNLRVPHKVFRFLDNISFAYKSADLVIARAGAMSLAEISFFGIPAILIPYPYSDGHQEDNASIFEIEEAALVISEENLSAEVLANNIKLIIDNSGKKEMMSYNMRKFAKPEATDNLVAQIKEMIYA